MGLFPWITGRVRVRVTGADIPGLLRTLADRGISICQVDFPDELNVVFTTGGASLGRLRIVTRRRGERLTVMEKRGLLYELISLRRRPVLCVGMAMLLALALMVPGRVCIVEVQGNDSIPDHRILEAAEGCGIRFGASRRDVRSEKVKNALLEAMPELAWAGVNTYGCRAVITVRQREIVADEQQPRVASIIALRDGVILSCDVTDGNRLCTPGQAVKAGQVLISGYTDCGICITATRARGEIMAATGRALTAVTPKTRLERGTVTGEDVQYSLVVGKNRINFNNCSGISDTSCGRMVTEYRLTLPGGYPLPVKLIRQTVTAYETRSREVTRAEAAAMLSDFAPRYLATQMIAGSITGSSETVTAGEDRWILAGKYACTEMIGAVRAELNGELHETN